MTLHALMLAGCAIAAPLHAQTAEPVATYDLPAQELGSALRAIGRQAGREIIFEADAVDGLRARPLRGRWTARDAVAQLLEGTGLEARSEDGAIIIRGRSQAAALDRGTGADIVVTGTHIRTSEPVSPVRTDSRRDIERRGRTTLGDYIRDLPQNFGGGQNPGIVGGGVQGGNENLAATSALNLRGLGADATLTLINGHRVAYDGAVQGVDISAIPLAALDRIEIVADGASALYGSDAVGGVANVILRRDAEGLWTSARLGGATDGGNFQQQYSAVSGARWQGGGFMVAGDLNRSTAIDAGQRSITRALDPSKTLLPRQRQVSGVLTGHQTLGAAELTLDAQYSRRTSFMAEPLSTTADARIDGNVYAPSAESWSVTPAVGFDIAAGWRAQLIGTYGQSLTKAPGEAYAGGALASTSHVFYDNRLATVELRLDGTLVDLPGGPLGLAVGGGYRRFTLQSRSRIEAGEIVIPLLNIDRRERVAFGYGELALPLFGPANRRPGLDFLQLTAAIRYEHYAGIDGVASPKFGAVWRPVPDVTLRTNWARSFKAPTFYQRYRTYQALLVPGSDFGETGPLRDRPVLYLAGGNADLEPERATSWTVSARYAPAAVPALRLELSWFRIRYRNRVANPIASVLGLFQNPVYDSLITFDPDATLQAALIAPAGGAFGLQNFTAAPYDPSTVYAVVDARSQNSANQAIDGIDLNAAYAFSLRSGGTIDLTASASRLDSDRRLIEGQPALPAAGVLFYPPHWRAQGGAVFAQDGVTLSVFVNYLAGVRDNRIQPEERVRGFVTTDLVARISGRGIFEGVDLTLAAINLFNRKPAVIRTSRAVDPPYDSTNGSVVGRMLNITLARQW
ncbi:outer membrane receptor protein involved in Fe transport [Sphingomonas zeicaulis]|uniref:TonB-dependent receptor domain-containing protein n=1 Tax=Sphingomonas zeicaulis TaxID=1632740 RepID=UPI003D225EE8